MRPALTIPIYAFLTAFSLGVSQNGSAPTIKNYTGFTPTELTEINLEKKRVERKEFVLNELAKPVLKFNIPVSEGQVSTIFHDYFREDHEGIDFGIPVDPKVRKVKIPSVFPVAPGVVKSVGETNTGYGKAVEIEHNGFISKYAHLSKIFVKEGDTVLTPDKIAIAGNGGNSTSSHGGTGIHLHLEVFDLKKGKKINPKFEEYGYLERDEIVYSNVQDVHDIPEKNTGKLEELAVVENTSKEDSSKALSTLDFLNFYGAHEEKIVKETYRIQVEASRTKLSEERIEDLKFLYNKPIKEEKIKVKGRMYYKYMIDEPLKSIDNAVLYMDHFEIKDKMNKEKGSKKNNRPGIGVYYNNELDHLEWNYKK